MPFVPEPDTAKVQVALATKSIIYVGQIRSFMKGALQSFGSPYEITPVPNEVKQPTGEPDTGNSPVRFGSKGYANQGVVPAL